MLGRDLPGRKLTGGMRAAEPDGVPHRRPRSTIQRVENFQRSTQDWFQSSFDGPTEVQRRGWEKIAAGDNALLVAPTGSGKTLAAFLWEIDRIAQLEAGVAPGVRCLYISPLKALVADVERNLRTPLAGIRRFAEKSGRPLRAIRVDVRTGDTPQKERQRQSRDPGDILVTTPESLFLILGSRQRETLRSVTTVIVDEIHALLPTKRGVHLALSLERLAEIADVEPQRIGLSATVRPLDEVARFLGGDRPVEVVDASAAPRIDLSIRVPVPDMENVPVATPRERGGPILAELARTENVDPGLSASDPGPRERGVWPAIYPELVAAVRAHRSTIIFVNSRALCERLVERLNELAETELVLAHHGSVSHVKRAAIEDALKRGDVRGIVATSSLELGIDMGAVDQVLLIESPGSVARGLQRIGRAGHGVGEISRGLLFPKFKGDLLECAVVAEGMQSGEIEGLRAPTHCLDVLAQQLVAMCCDRERAPRDLGRLVRRAHPYRELSDSLLNAVIEMLSGRYPSSELADLRPRLNWDRSIDKLTARPGAALVTRINSGTIPDRGVYAVHIGEDGPRIGELDEEMVFESRSGDTFLLGASTWRIEEITADRVVVSPAPGEPGRLPFWRGDGPGRPLELGRAMGAFTRKYGIGERRDVAVRLREALPLDHGSAENLAGYLVDQREHTGALPTDRAITVERFRDELGDWRVCILSPFGARVHAPWAMALERSFSNRVGAEVSFMYTDDGIVVRFADMDELPAVAELFPDPDEIEDLVTDQLASTSLFASLFRENAVRSLLVTRRRPDQRNPLWLQRRKARELLAVVRRYPSFPIVLETYRQAMNDVFDLDGLRSLLSAVRDRSLRVDEVETPGPSPFARSLVFAYVAEYLYDDDSPLAERKAQALTLDREMLRELLGQGELRELLDEGVIDALELELAGRAEGRLARDADELGDLLRRVGDLTSGEAVQRTVADEAEVLEWFAALRQQCRSVPMTIADEPRWISVDDAGLFRDALGCVPPAGLPSDCLEPVENALEVLVRRYARVHGPFTTASLAQRYGLVPGQLELVLRLLESAGALVHGEMRPGGTQLEWCDADVLRRIKRRTLARLRNEVAPVDAPNFGRFLDRWQGLVPAAGATHVGDRLDEVVGQLAGLPLSWRELTLEVLPARVPGFTLDALDLAATQGRLAWVGRGALGPSDGRVVLFRREDMAELLEDRAVDEDQADGSPLHTAIRAVLESHGASFWTEIERAVLSAHTADRRDLEAALWDLVWAGELTNDTFQPLRSLQAARQRRSTSRRSARAGVLSGGRWSLVSGLLSRFGEVSPTERTVARARMLLDRYGVVSRDMARAEELPGGWGPLYRVLRSMEEAGRVRRGYFVEGLNGAQFASPGAADRLRAERIEPGDSGRSAAQGGRSLTVLSAADPAQPYGTVLPWPPSASESRKLRRVRGARVVLAKGAPVLYLPPNGRHAVTFETPSGEDQKEGMQAAFALLAESPRAAGRPWLTIETFDGVPVEDSPWCDVLERAGFVRELKGYAVDRLRSRLDSPRPGHA